MTDKDKKEETEKLTNLTINSDCSSAFLLLLLIFDLKKQNHAINHKTRILLNKKKSNK